LKEIVALLRSDAPLGHSGYPLADLLNDHRLIRKKPGNWKSILEPSAQEKYADAAKWVRGIEEMKREWDKVKGEDWAKGITPQIVYGEWAKNRTSFKVIEDHVDDISDPVAHVAQKMGLGAVTLQNVLLGKTGFGRGRKRKPAPASK
jgi:hypothetical protein